MSDGITMKEVNASVDMRVAILEGRIRALAEIVRILVAAAGGIDAARTSRYQCLGTMKKDGSLEHFGDLPTPRELSEMLGLFLKEIAHIEAVHEVVKRGAEADEAGESQDTG